MQHFANRYELETFIGKLMMIAAEHCYCHTIRSSCHYVAEQVVEDYAPDNKQERDRLHALCFERYYSERSNRA